MSKNYFEMNEKERQLRHISETIEYADYFATGAPERNPVPLH